MRHHFPGSLDFHHVDAVLAHSPGKLTMADLARILWIDAAIRARRFPNPDSVAEEFRVTPRAIYQDVRYLRVKMHAPIKHDPIGGGWIYTDPTFLVGSLLLTASEVEAVRRTYHTAREFLGPGDAKPLRDIAALNVRPGVALDTGGSETVHGAVRLTQDVGASSDLLQDCRIALVDRRRLHIRYYSAERDDERERVVRPYHLMNWLGEHYLIAWCEWRQETRQFLLGRIRDWTILPGAGAYTRDTAFDITSYLRGLSSRHGEPLVTVRARFSPYQARWIRERIFHQTQTIEEQPGGGLILTLRVAGTFEARRWLMSYGAEVEVLSPEKLRHEILEETEKIRKIYCPELPLNE